VDLIDPKTIRLFTDNIGKNKVDFITADGGFDWKNENTQEQEAFKLIFAQIVTALKIQAKGGNFICKLFESFTTTTIKFMCILSSVYEHIYLTKPLTSRQSNSEKYIVCINFKGITDKELSNLESIIKDALKHKNKNLVDIYPSFNIPQDYLTTITKINTTISNRQLISINQIVDFIQKQNYRGDTYHNRRDMQIKATKYWLNRFFPERNKFNEQKNTVSTETVNLINKNQKVVNTLIKHLE
jgi:cap1 methyltransferase